MLHFFISQQEEILIRGVFLSVETLVVTHIKILLLGCFRLLTIVKQHTKDIPSIFSTMEATDSDKEKNLTEKSIAQVR